MIMMKVTVGVTEIPLHIVNMKWSYSIRPERQGLIDSTHIPHTCEYRPLPPEAKHEPPVSPWL